MSANPAKSMVREQVRATAKEGSRVFREALKMAENVEAGLKQTVNRLPAANRLAIAWRVLWGRWQ